MGQNKTLKAARPDATQTADDLVLIDYAADDQELDEDARGVIITTAGTLKVDTLRGNTVTTQSLAVGQYAFGFRKIYKTGSSAAGIILL